MYFVGDFATICWDVSVDDAYDYTATQVSPFVQTIVSSSSQGTDCLSGTIGEVDAPQIGVEIVVTINGLTRSSAAYADVIHEQSE